MKTDNFATAVLDEATTLANNETAAAERDYHALLEDIAAGSAPDASEVLAIVRAAGKTLDDLRADLRTLDTINQHRQHVADADDAASKSAKLQAERKAADDLLMQQTRDHRAKVEEIDRELASLRQITQRGATARHKLWEFAQKVNPELAAEYREACQVCADLGEPLPRLRQALVDVQLSRDAAALESRTADQLRRLEKIGEGKDEAAAKLRIILLDPVEHLRQPRQKRLDAAEAELAAAVARRDELQAALFAF